MDLGGWDELGDQDWHSYTIMCEIDSQSYDFFSSHVQMWKLDIKEAECQGIDVELWCWRRCFSHSDSKEIKPVKRKSTLNIHWKDWCRSSDTLATWCKEATHWKRPWYWERLSAEVEGDEQRMRWFGWHHWLNGHEFKQTLGDSEGQVVLQCCSPWCRRVEHDWATEQQQNYCLTVTYDPFWPNVLKYFNIFDKFPKSQNLLFFNLFLIGE